MSGDGEYIPHNGTGIPSNAMPAFVIPPGNGSGCVTSGPFSNMTVRLGPITPSLYGLTANPQADGLGLNERCLRRDLSNAGAARGSTEAISCEFSSDLIAKKRYKLLTHPRHRRAHHQPHRHLQLPNENARRLPQQLPRRARRRSLLGWWRPW
jgi:hypothetical protein